MSNADASCGDAGDGFDVGSGDMASEQVTDAISDATTDVATDSSAAEKGGDDGGCGLAVGDLPGLVLWLKPGATVLDSANHVARWTDSSAHHNDAVQDSLTNRPSAGSEPDGGAQQAIVKFDTVGTWLEIADDESMHFGTDDVLFAGVLEDDRTAPGYDAVAFRKQNGTTPPNTGFSVWMNMTSSTNPGVFSSMGGMIDDQYTLQSLRAYNDDRFHIVLRIDGSEQVTADSLPSPYDISSTEPAFIGAHGNGGGPYPAIQQIQGSIAEILIVDGRADDALVSAIECDLSSRHGISLP